MISLKHHLNKTKDLKINIFICLILFVLFLISIFSIVNLVAVINLQNQIDTMLADSNNNVSSAKDNGTVNNNVIQNTPATTNPISKCVANVVDKILNFGNQDDNSNTTNPNNSSNIINTSNSNKPTPVVSIVPPEKVYYNVTAEPFFGKTLINTQKTNFHFDDIITSLTFDPNYELKYEKTCTDEFCGLRDQKKLSCLKSGCLFASNNKIYFKDTELRLPNELQNKEIVNVLFNPLTTKWVVSFVEGSAGQETAYVYLFDGTNLTPLITDDANRQIKTRYGYGGGSVAASGSDDQFIIFYSGYEGIAYLYNNGVWQDLSVYFSLRMMEGGFKAKIIKGGDGKLANWYICSDDGSKAKLIKLWQNNTDTIQGAIDLSSVLNGQAFICNASSDRELTLISNKQYTFKDNGFKNSKDYSYESNNLSSYTDKKIMSIQLSKYFINANYGSYSFGISLDGKNWQNYSGSELTFENKDNLSTFYVKADFKKGDLEYSPWFGGIDIISYSAVDKK